MRRVTKLSFLISLFSGLTVHMAFAGGDNVRVLDPKWSFEPGREFPGAGGQVIPGNGGATRSDVLRYQLGCGVKVATLPEGRQCGRYVGMSFRPNPPIDVKPGDVPALSMTLWNPQGVLHPALRVKDATGQILQFPLRARTLENPSGRAPQKVIQYVGRSNIFFGGAADGTLHPPIKEISVLAGDTGILFPDGELHVSDLQYIASDDAVVDLAKLQFATPWPVFETYVGHLAAAAHSPTPAMLDKARSVGIHIIRTDMFWHVVERNGRFNFDRYDKLADQLSQRGMSALWILDYGHPDHGGGPPVTDDQRQAFVAFARSAAQRYKGNVTHAFEVWNEPHLAHYWKNPDPIAYGKLLLASARAIKAVAPGTKVVSSGVGTPDIPFVTRMLSVSPQWPLDAIGLHPYRKDAPENHAAYVEPWRQALQAAGSNLPIWDTEWGYSAAGDLDKKRYGDAGDERAQWRHANLQLRKVLTQMALGTPLHTLYVLNDTGTDAGEREHNFGLLRKDGSDKPAMQALRMLFEAQAGRRFVGLASNAPPGVHVAKWVGKDDVAYAVWSDAAGRDWQLRSVDKRMSIRQVRGAENGFDRQIRGDLKVVEDEGVIFLYGR